MDYNDPNHALKYARIEEERRIESPDGNLIAMKFGQKYQATDMESHQTLMTNSN